MINPNKIKTIVRVVIVALMLTTVAVPALAERAELDLGVEVVGDQTGLSGGEDTDLRAVIGSIINTALSFLGVVAVIIVLIGGFKYMTAGGSEEKVGDAKKWIISGIIGLAIILAAYAITSFVIERLTDSIDVE